MMRSLLPLLGLILLSFLPACDVGDDDDAADDDDVADDDAVDDDDSSSDDDDSSTDDDAPGAIPVGSNVLLLIADDLGLDGASFDSTSPCYAVGNVSDDAPMPNLAALCASGVRFENAWAMPTCSPTRATMLTGTFPYQHGVGGPLQGGPSGNALDLTTPTLPRLLAEHAPQYATANIGKWHLSLQDDAPGEAGWQHFAGLIRGGVQSYTAWDRVVDGTAGNETGYATSVNVDDAISWLGTLEEGAPWLLWMAFNAPHTPFHKPPNDLHDYDHLEDNDDVPVGQAGEYYLAMLQALDTEIGRLFDHLRATGDYDDTVVIFLGDNGSARSVVGEPFDHDHAKGTLSEGGAAVPFVVAGPGIAGGRADAALVSVVDVFATVLETAGIDVATATAADPVDSESLWPVLLQSGEGREQMLTQLFGGQNSEGRDEGHAIRDATFKLICRLDGTVDLFDLATDRWEATDLYVTGPAAGLETVYADLAAALEAWIGQDVCP